VQNVGAADLTWSVVENPAASWLDETPTGGTLVPSGSTDVTVTFDATGLSDGVYSTTLEVTSDDPDEPQVDVSVVLTVTTACVPVDGADFVYSPASPEVGETVTFTGSVSAGTPPVSYAWDFGDGSTGSGQEVTHVYTASHTYTVVMTATNACGEVVASDTVVVTAPSEPDIDVAPLSLSATLNPGGTATRTLSVQNTGTADLTWSVAENPAASWLDETPTGGTLVPSGSTDVTVTFDATGLSDGVYSTTLEVTSDDPDEPQVDVSVVLTVTSACIPVDGVDFVYSPATPEIGETVLFTGSVANGTPPITYTWYFGDGSLFVVGRRVTHVFPLTATLQSYTVTLNAANACPSQQEVEQVITVLPRYIYLPVTLRDF
jgi:PKD repeat protein